MPGINWTERAQVAESDLAEAMKFIQRISDGIERVHYPSPTADREWVCDIQAYLRGKAACVLLISPEDMRRLEQARSP